jgi:hypothetical protein
MGVGTGPHTYFYLSNPADIAAKRNYFDAREADASRKFQKDTVLPTQERMSALPQNLRQQRFDTVFPFLQSAYGGLSSQQSAQPTQGPAIDAGPVWSGRQVDQRVNQMRAGNDATAARQTAGARENLAGRGYSSRSPLLNALTAQHQGQALAANTRGENDLRWQASAGNAEQTLKGQVARDQAFGDRQSESIERGRTQSQLLAAILGSMGGLV